MNNSQSYREDSSSHLLDIITEEENAQSSAVVPLIFLTQRQTEALRQLGQITMLPENWDSYGSPPPTHHAVKVAVEMLTRVDLPDLTDERVVPVSGGGLQLEWRTASKEVELEILSDGSVEYLKLERGQPIGEGHITPVTPNQVQFLLAWLASKTTEEKAA